MVIDYIIEIFTPVNAKKRHVLTLLTPDTTVRAFPCPKNGN
jgi:hypothetical protein